MIVIALSGKRHSGKSLCGEMLRKHGYRSIGFADALKKMCREQFNLTQRQTDTQEGKAEFLPDYQMTVRDLLISVGNYYRSVDPLFWVRKTLTEMTGTTWAGNGPRKFVITDCRYENEVDALKPLGAYLVRLNRSAEFRPPYDRNVDGTASETALDKFKGWDLVVDERANRSMEDMRAIAARIANNVTQRGKNVEAKAEEVNKA